MEPQGCRRADPYCGKKPLMPRTRTASKPSKARTKPQKPALRLQGWRTTDDEEIERRRQRAATEPLTVEPIEPGHRVFGTFRVASDGGSSYEVEIRSLTRHDNSCGCPDFQVNGLGTCKHVEAVLARIRPAKVAAPERIEVFLRRAGERPQVKAQWPGGSRRTGAFALVDRFFLPSGELRRDPLTLLPQLARALPSAPAPSSILRATSRCSMTRTTCSSASRRTSSSSTKRSASRTGRAAPPTPSSA